MNQIYLDNQATTPLDPNVLSEMMPWLKNKFGNASSRNHSYGWEANDAIEISRQAIADLICASSKEIFFTSGATESNNIAIQGIANEHKNIPAHIITVKTEHPAVLDICNHLEKEKFSITTLSVNKDGILDIEKFKSAIQSNTILVSIMHANNEIGVIQPIRKIGEICMERGITFHVDAAQSAGKIPLDVKKMNIDLLSMSSHKIYGPKGIGALYKRNGIKIKPLMYGGGHELGMRPGTLAVPNIVGFGKACEIAKKIMKNDDEKISKLKNLFLSSIQNEITDYKINGTLEKRLAGNLNICFMGINNEALIASLPSIAFSSSAACTSSKMTPSHVLLALGLSKKDVFCSVRFGIGRFNTEKEINEVIEKLILSINKLKNK